MKSVIISIKPYWVFLIIAKTMGWYIYSEKTIEVRKTCPKDNEWNKIGKIYCTKDKQSFNCIPKEYQPFMQKFLGKGIGEFVCDYILQFTKDDYDSPYDISDDDLSKTCLRQEDLYQYGKGKTLYGWHISDLVIYDDPKELEAFTTFCYANKKRCANCKYYLFDNDDLNGYRRWCDVCHRKPLARPPQSWCYIEGAEE
nr:MAG TPA: activating signal cointegrator [Caudoviricetes sp.]